MGTAAAPVIAAVTTLGDGAQTAGVVVAALLAAAVLLVRSPRTRSLAMLGALVLTPVLLVANIWSTPQFEPLRGRPALLLGAAGAGLVVLALGALAIHRRPVLLALAAAATLPFRVPIESGGDTANLLVPLYLVIASGVLAYAVPHLRAPRGLDDADDVRARGLLEWLLAAGVVLYAVQAAYSSSFDAALAQVIFFYVPFALLYALLVRLEWTPRLAVQCLVVAVVLAAAFVGIGFVEYAKRELLLNPKVISSNQFESYFRVNSLFFDPNIYGRFLVTVMLGVMAVLLWVRRPLVVAGCAAVLGLLWAGLVLTLSQSSFTALLAGLAVLGALRWGVARIAALVGALAVAGVVVVLVAPGAVGLDQSADAVTSGRSTLVEGGVELFTEKPVTGWGAGSFRNEYRLQEKSSNARASAASHTIPITVAAEQGAGGLALYLALVLVAIAGLLRGARTSIARAAVAAAFVALVVHTLLYAAFLEDPLAWALLAVGTALAPEAARRSAREPAPAAPARLPRPPRLPRGRPRRRDPLARAPRPRRARARGGRDVGARPDVSGLRRLPAPRLGPRPHARRDAGLRDVRRADAAPALPRARRAALARRPGRRPPARARHGPEPRRADRRDVRPRARALRAVAGRGGRALRRVELRVPALRGAGVRRRPVPRARRLGGGARGGPPAARPRARWSCSRSRGSCARRPGCSPGSTGSGACPAATCARASGCSRSSSRRRWRGRSSTSPSPATRSSASTRRATSRRRSGASEG